MARTRRSVAQNSALIDHLRKRKGWTIEELAQKADIGLRTAQKAINGESIGMESLQLIADQLEVTYASLLTEDECGPLISGEIVFEADFMEFPENVIIRFIDLIKTTVHANGVIVFRHIKKGSLILGFGMSREDMFQLVEIFPEFRERARDAIRATPEGEAFFSGVEVASVGRLLELVDRVTELRIQVAPGIGISTSTDELPPNGPALTPETKDHADIFASSAELDAAPPSPAVPDSENQELRKVICDRLREHMTLEQQSLNPSNQAKIDAVWADIKAAMQKLYGPH